MMFTYFRLLVTICCAAFSLHFARAQSLSDIIEVTRAREANIRSVRITWNETRVMTAALLEKLGALPGSLDVQSPPYPVRLLISDRKVLYETRLPRQEGNGYSGDQSFVTGFDEEVDWHWGGNPPHGGIRASEEYSDLRVITIHAWTLYIRPMEILKLSMQTYDVETPQTVLSDRPCVVVRERAGANGHVRRRIWLDRERKFVVVRLSSEFDGWLRAQLTVDYREHPDIGWIPARWDTAIYGADKALHDATDATLTDAQFNQDIEPSQFSPHFPVGTKVSDERQDGRAFYALANGELRPYTREDDRGSWSLPVPAWTVAAIVFCGLTILLLWRRSRLQSD